MAFHVSAIIARQWMRFVFFRYWQFILKQSENELQFLDNLRPIFISFEILLKLSGDFQSLHRESTKLRKFERSSVSKLSDVSASFMAARVVLFGFSETKASSTLSTRLLRLRLCFLASIWRRWSKFSLNRNEVCFLVTDVVFIDIPFCSAKIVHLYNISKYSTVQLLQLLFHLRLPTGSEGVSPSPLRQICGFATQPRAIISLR